MNVASARLAFVAATPDSFPKDGRPEVCILGRSNVGKSSLINRLLGLKGLARVSKTPGRTREIHFYLLDERRYLVDLPGFGYAKVPAPMRRAWADLVEGYFARAAATLRLAVQLVDIRREPTELDHELARLLAGRELPSCLVLTKADKVSGSHAALMRKKAPEALALPAGVPVVVSSASTGAGFAELWKIVLEAYGR